MNEDQKTNQEGEQFEHLIQGLINDQYGCIDNFFDVDTIVGLRNTLLAFQSTDKMKSAGLGNKSSFQQDKKIRGDKIKWLETDTVDVYESAFLQKMDKFIAYLNSSCFTSILNFECHFASYEKNSFYKRHLDQFKNDTGRKFSVILYLNENWQPEDGGILSLYPKGGDQLDVSPLGGRLVFFKSDEMEHEVHPSFTRERNSIAGWLKS